MCAVLFVALPGTAYYTAPAVMLTKLYANTIVTSFNNRALLQRTSQDVVSLAMRDIEFARGNGPRESAPVCATSSDGDMMHLRLTTSGDWMHTSR